MRSNRDILITFLKHSELRSSTVREIDSTSDSQFVLEVLDYQVILSSIPGLGHTRMCPLLARRYPRRGGCSKVG